MMSRYGSGYGYGGTPVGDVPAWLWYRHGYGTGLAVVPGCGTGSAVVPDYGTGSGMATGCGTGSGMATDCVPATGSGAGQSGQMCQCWLEFSTDRRIPSKRHIVLWF